MNELTLEGKALRAQALLRDPILIEAFARVEEEAWGRFKESQPEQTEAREKAYYLIHALDEVAEVLRGHVAELHIQQRKTGIEDKP